MSKRELKKYLSQQTNEQLQESFLELYDKFSVVKTYYDFVFNPNEKKLISEAKSKIANEFFPLNRKRPKLRRSVPQNYFKHFISLGVDSFLIADLMLYTIETAQKLTSQRTIKQETFFKGQYRSFEQAIQFSISRGVYRDFVDRIKAVEEIAVAQEWTNSTQFSELLERFDS